MPKTKQSASLGHIQSYAGVSPFGSSETEREESEGLTLMTLASRVKNLENTVRVLLEQVTDLSLQLDTERQQPPHKETQCPPQPKKQQPQPKKSASRAAPLTPEASEQLTQEAMEIIVVLLSASDALCRDAIKEKTGLSGNRTQKALKNLRAQGTVVHEDGVYRLVKQAEIHT